MPKLKVAMVCKLYPPWIGGLEAHVATLAAALTHLDPQLDVTVITGQTGPARARRENTGRVQVWRATTGGRIARTPITLGLRAMLAEVSADVYHFHSPFPWGEAVALTSPLTAPFVVTYHHDVVRQRALFKLYRPWLARLLHRAARIIAWSPQLIASSPMLRDHHNKTVVIPGGIDTRRFLPTGQSRQRAAALRSTIAPAGPVVLYVGRLVYYKGLPDLLAAMVHVPGTLLIVGAGPLHEKLQQQAQQLAITDRVHFAGVVTDAELPLYYQASDVLVLPSSAPTEAFGLVQLEAHASGIPSICTNLPTGVTFANIAEETGLVVPVGDRASLAAALNRLLHDSEERHRLGRAAQQRARAKFDQQHCARDVLNLYHDVLNQA